MRPTILNNFFKSVGTLSGVGAKRAELLNKLLKKDSEASCKDLLFHLPSNIIQRVENPDLLNPSIIGQEVILNLEVSDSNKAYGRRKMMVYNGVDAKGFVIKLTFFNGAEKFYKDKLKIGSKIKVEGRLEQSSYSGLQITHPRVFYQNEKANLQEVIYPLTAGLNSKNILFYVKQILSSVNDIPEWIDAQYLKRNNFPSFVSAIKQLHNPKNISEISIDNPARKRLAFDELLASQVSMALSRKSVQKNAGVLISNAGENLKLLEKALPFKLTQGQQDIIAEVLKDLKSEHKMFRLIQGDVGSGKTMVALAGILTTVESGFQAAFMLPTEILAEQQFANFSNIFSHDIFGGKIKCVLLKGGQKTAERRNALEKIESGNAQIIIGTHAIFQDKIIYKNLALVVIDEQHRFGVKQRMKLSEKGFNANVMLMSATPIPRTLAMTLYGDLDISILNEKPKGRQEIDTRIISSAKTDEIIEKLKNEISEGAQVYWICPLVNEQEESPFFATDDEKVSAEERFKTLQKVFGKEVGLVHGQMKSDEKNQGMVDFKNAKTKILVATTVVEVGVDVPNATIMIIENAESFGLSQLHQLRGRVGRGDKKSKCILLYGKKLSGNSQKRLEILRESNDGFRIAEEDLAIRGYGDLLGTRQSGFPDFIIAVLPDNKDLLFAARDYAKMIMESNPNLEGAQGDSIKNLLHIFEYENQLKHLEA